MIIKWLKNKLRIWLGIENDLLNTSHKLSEFHKSFSDKNKHLQTQLASLEKDVSLFKSTCDIGVDVHQRTDSWAVVCIAGKKEYVNFVRLDSRDARNVMYFLKRFENSNSRVVDAPYGLMECFKY